MQVPIVLNIPDDMVVLARNGLHTNIAEINRLPPGAIRDSPPLAAFVFLIIELTKQFDNALSQDGGLMTQPAPYISARQLAGFAKHLNGIVKVNGHQNFTMLVEGNNLNITQP